MKVKKKSIIIHETPAQSFINDAITYGFLAGMFWVNKAHLDSAIPEWLLGGIAILFMGSKMLLFFAGERIHHTDAESACEAIREFYGEDNQSSGIETGGKDD